MATAFVNMLRLANANFVSITTTRMNNAVAAIAGKAKACVTATAAGREAGLSADKIEVSGYVVP